MLLISKMSQDFFYDVLLLNTRDDSDRSPAAAADLNVDTEHAFQSLGPGHRSVTLGGRSALGFRTRRFRLASPGRGD